MESPPPWSFRLDVYAEGQDEPVALGTAWFASPNRVATARHVAAPEGFAVVRRVLHLPGGEVEATQDLDTDRDHDIALLTVSQPRPELVLTLGTFPARDERWIAPGFPSDTNRTRWVMGGTVRDVHGQANQRIQLFVEEGTYVNRGQPGWGGCSGAPVLVDERVVGVLTRQDSGLRDTVFAATLERIRAWVGIATAIENRQPPPASKPMVPTPSVDRDGWDLFLAHAEGDLPSAEALFSDLAPHCRVFLASRSLQLGDDFDTAIASAQRQSRVTVVLVSSRTEKAYYQREEIAAAIALAQSEAGRHRVVPLYLDGRPDEHSAVPYGLRLKHGLVLGPQLDLCAAAKRLLPLVGSGVASPPTTPQEAQRGSERPTHVIVGRGSPPRPIGVGTRIAPRWILTFRKGIEGTQDISIDVGGSWVHARVLCSESLDLDVALLGVDGDLPSPYAVIDGDADKISPLEPSHGYSPGEGLFVGERLVGIVSSTSPTSIPAARFAGTPLLKAALGGLHEELDALVGSVGEILGRSLPLQQALASELRLPGADRGSIARALVWARALEAIQAISGATAVLRGNPEVFPLVHTLLEQLLPLAIDWHGTRAYAREQLNAGKNVCALSWSHRTIAAIVLSGADAQPCKFQPLGQDGILRGVGCLDWPSVTKDASLLKKAPHTLRQAVIQELAAKLGLDPSDPDVGMEVAAKLRTELRSRWHKHRRYLLLVDRDIKSGAQALWEVAQGALGDAQGQAELPGLRLVRMQGRPTELELDIANALLELFQETSYVPNR